MSAIIVFDIETGPLPADQLAAAIDPFPEFVAPGPFDPKAVRLGNTKDETKIKEKIEAARQKHADESASATEKHAAAKAEYERSIIDRAALSATTGQVLAIGYYRNGQEAAGFWADGEKGEVETIRQFWANYELASSLGQRLVGFNCHGFDLPFLMQRSWLLGVPMPSGVLDKDRYWSPTFVDLMVRWQCGNRQNSISLDRLSRALGIGAKNGDGAAFAKLWANDRAAAIEYLKNDIKLTYKAAKRLGVA